MHTDPSIAAIKHYLNNYVLQYNICCKHCFVLFESFFRSAIFLWAMQLEHITTQYIERNISIWNSFWGVCLSKAPYIWNVIVRTLCVHFCVCVCVCVCGCACACACTCIFTWTQPRLCCLILLSPYCFSFSMNKIIVEKKVIDRQTDRRPDGQTGGQPACPAETAYLGVFPEQVFLACHCWLGSSANKPTHSSLCKEDWSRPELSKVHVCVCVCVCVCKCVCVYVCAQSDWCLLWLVITEIMERN